MPAMKRDRDGDAADPHHPALAFHREVLIIQQWTKIRREFLQALEAVAADGVVRWREPRKLWRHAQEALGKWILSQVARVHLPAPDAGNTAAAAPASASASAPLHEAEIFFFPSTAQLRRAMVNTGTASGNSNSSSDAPATLRTYDEQLIRDLSLKSNGADETAAVAALARLVADFRLPQRCAAASAAVAAGMRDVTPSQALQPRIRRVEADDPQRTPAQTRIAGPVAEVAVVWPRHWRREQCRDCPPVSLPWAAMEKLQVCYKAFADAAGERARYGDEADSGAQRRFELRAATVILRYEGGLATGSLQLCADTRLKRHLHAAGYHVMDLCASPINAYMGVPQPGTFRGATAATEAAKEVPNRFCSAFYDVDRYFGSVGSAVAVDPQHMHADPAINPEGRPLLLTLDVPYDEDLCELLFHKLVRDMRVCDGAAVDYILVLPLWWDIQMRIDKRLFAGGQAADVAQVVQERAAVLGQGYQVPYSWPAALADAAGDARRSSAAAWVCFDGVFIEDDYGYFCTATNKWLHGVTATEVIGLAQPRQPAPPLRGALDAFYGTPTGASS